MGPMHAIAWDIDGTLIDSEPLHDMVLHETCAAWGVDLSDIPTHHFRGVHMPDVWTLLRPRFPASLPETEWHAALTARYVERAPELKPLANAVAVMQLFAEAGLRQVCVSNSSRPIVDANLRVLAVDDIIDFSISLDDVNAGKPHPEPYLKAAQRLGLVPHAMAAVEDSHAGATSARDAGLRVFALAPPGNTLTSADITIRQLTELPGLILPMTSSSLQGERNHDGV